MLADVRENAGGCRRLPEGLEDALREGNLELGNFCPDFLPQIQFRLLGRVQLYSVFGTPTIFF